MPWQIPSLAGPRELARRRFMDQTSCRESDNRDSRSMTLPNASLANTHASVQGMLRDYVMNSRLAEVVYRDSAGQICLVHDTIRDLLSRAGQDFVLLGRGQLVALDHLLTVDGITVTGRQY